jgi:hypothetical protein
MLTCPNFCCSVVDDELHDGQGCRRGCCGRGRPAGLPPAARGAGGHISSWWQRRRPLDHTSWPLRADQTAPRVQRSSTSSLRAATWPRRSTARTKPAARYIVCCRGTHALAGRHRGYEAITTGRCAWAAGCRSMMMRSPPARIAWSRTPPGSRDVATHTQGGGQAQRLASLGIPVVLTHNGLVDRLVVSRHALNIGADLELLEDVQTSDCGAVGQCVRGRSSAVADLGTCRCIALPGLGPMVLVGPLKPRLPRATLRGPLGERRVEPRALASCDVEQCAARTERCSTTPTGSQ